MQPYTSVALVYSCSIGPYTHTVSEQDRCVHCQGSCNVACHFLSKKYRGSMPPTPFQNVGGFHTPLPNLSYAYEL